MPAQRDLLLITGIPGTGKTWYGDKFARDFGFEHYDIEEQRTLNRFAANPQQFMAEIVALKKNAVVTWGFAPDHDLSVRSVLDFKSNGFKLIWFDGNRPAALERFEARAKSKSNSTAEYYLRMHEFYLQLYRIEASKIIGSLKPAVVNSFDSQGSFKSVATLLEEIKTR